MGAGGQGGATAGLSESRKARPSRLRQVAPSEGPDPAAERQLRGGFHGTGRVAASEVSVAEEGLGGGEAPRAAVFLEPEGAELSGRPCVLGCPTVSASCPCGLTPLPFLEVRSEGFSAVPDKTLNLEF